MPAPPLPPGPSPSPAGAERRWRVAVLDDDTLIREGLATRMGGLHVVSETANYAALRADLATVGPVDVVLLDLKLHAPGTPVAVHGRQAVTELAADGYPVLIYTNDQRPVVLAACLAAGARGVLHKSEPIDRLRTAITTVASGSYHVSTAVIGLAEVLAHRGQLSTLTPRQLDVLRARARGESYAQAGTRLHLSPRTVESYMADVIQKFAAYVGVRSPSRVASLASDFGSRGPK